jgi:acetolactate synthase-1/2/3 large subunit
MKPITKFAATVPHTQRIPELISVIVEAMGGYGELVTQPQDIRPAMERARASGKPSCVNIILDPDIYSSGTMNQTMYK